MRTDKKRELIDWVYKQKLLGHKKSVAQLRLLAMTDKRLANWSSWPKDKLKNQTTKIKKWEQNNPNLLISYIESYIAERYNWEEFNLWSFHEAWQQASFVMADLYSMDVFLTNSQNLLETEHISFNLLKGLSIHQSIFISFISGEWPLQMEQKRKGEWIKIEEWDEMDSLCRNPHITNACQRLAALQKEMVQRNSQATSLLNTWFLIQLYQTSLGSERANKQVGANFYKKVVKQCVQMRAYIDQLPLRIALRQLDALDEGYQSTDWMDTFDALVNFHRGVSDAFMDLSLSIRPLLLCPDCESCVWLEEDEDGKLINNPDDLRIWEFTRIKYSYIMTEYVYGKHPKQLLHRFEGQINDFSYEELTSFSAIIIKADEVEQRRYVGATQERYGGLYTLDGNGMAFYPYQEDAYPTTCVFQDWIYLRRVDTEHPKEEERIYVNNYKRKANTPQAMEKIESPVALQRGITTPRKESDYVYFEFDDATYRVPLSLDKRLQRITGNEIVGWYDEREGQEYLCINMIGNIPASYLEKIK